MAPSDAFAVHLVELLGAGVPRFEIGVANRPVGGDAVDVLDRLEVAFPESEQDSAIHLGIAADVVVLFWAELLAVLIGPFAGVVISPFGPDRSRAPVFGFARQPTAALDKQNACTRRCQSMCDRAASGPGPDDDDVVVVGHGISLDDRERGYPGAGGAAQLGV